MRGQTIFSYALVAFATTAYAAPLKVRTDDLLEREPYVGKLGAVNIGEEYVERRQATTSKTVAAPEERALDVKRAAASDSPAAATDPLSGLLGGGGADPLSSLTGALGGVATGGAAGANPLSSLTGALGGAGGATGTGAAAADPLSSLTGALGGGATGSDASGGGDLLSGISSLIPKDVESREAQTDALTGLLGGLTGGTGAATGTAGAAADPLSGLLGDLTGAGGAGGAGAAGADPLSSLTGLLGGADGAGATTGATGGSDPLSESIPK